MKTMEQMYNEALADKDLRASLIKAAKAGKLKEFLKDHGCEATLEEVTAFLRAKAEQDAPLSFDELENTAGGECSQTDFETAISIGFVGIACAIYAAVSAGLGHVGRRNENEGRICNKGE